MMKTAKSPYGKLEGKLGYVFKDKSILQRALTRQSAIREKNLEAASHDFQRLEWVGDKAFNYHIASLLHTRAPASLTEGQLDPLLQAIVRNAQGPLLEVANKLDLKKWLIMGKGETTSITNQILVDAMEAIIGAIAIEASTGKALINFIHKHFAVYVESKLFTYTSQFATPIPLPVNTSPVPMEIEQNKVSPSLEVQKKLALSPLPDLLTINIPTPINISTVNLSATENKKEAFQLFYLAAASKSLPKAEAYITAAKAKDATQINYPGRRMTPLMNALKLGKYENAALLVKHGANWDQACGSQNQEAKTRKTPDDIAKKKNIPEPTIRQIKGLN